jgi:hypothetical protein
MLRVGHVEVFFRCPMSQEVRGTPLPLRSARRRLPHAKLDDLDGLPVPAELTFDIPIENQDGHVMVATSQAPSKGRRRLRAPTSAGRKDIGGDEDSHAVTVTSLSIMLSGI